jgi:hypothetical protein
LDDAIQSAHAPQTLTVQGQDLSSSRCPRTPGPAPAGPNPNPIPECAQRRCWLSVVSSQFSVLSSRR